MADRVVARLPSGEDRTQECSQQRFKYGSPASGNEQLGNSYILAFTAADLGPEQFDCRRSPAVEKAVEFVQDYLRAGTKHCREVYEAATTLPVSRSVIFKAARCLGIRMNGSGLWTLPKAMMGRQAVESSLAGRKCG